MHSFPHAPKHLAGMEQSGPMRLGSQRHWPPRQRPFPSQALGQAASSQRGPERPSGQETSEQSTPEKPEVQTHLPPKQRPCPEQALGHWGNLAYKAGVEQSGNA